MRNIHCDSVAAKALASKSSSSVDARLCVCFVRVRVFCQYSPRKSRSSLSNVYVPPLAYNFASLVLVFRRLGFKTLNKLKCAKKKHLRKETLEALHFHRILSQTCRNDNNSNSRGGKKRPPRLSRWKRIRTRALSLFCCVVLLVFYV